MRFGPADGPIGGEQEQAVALHVLHGLGIAGEVEVAQDVGVGVVLDPAQLISALFPCCCFYLAYPKADLPFDYREK